MPATPPGRALLASVSGPATVSVIVAEALPAGVDESVTFATKLLVPATVGVPLMRPTLLNESPAGSAPDAIEYVYGCDPPLDASDAPYAVPSTP